MRTNWSLVGYMFKVDKKDNSKTSTKFLMLHILILNKDKILLLCHYAGFSETAIRGALHKKCFKKFFKFYRKLKLNSSGLQIH